MDLDVNRAEGPFVAAGRGCVGQTCQPLIDLSRCAGQFITAYALHVGNRKQSTFGLQAQGLQVR